MNTIYTCIKSEFWDNKFFVPHQKIVLVTGTKKKPYYHVIERNSVFLSTSVKQNFEESKLLNMWLIDIDSNFVIVLITIMQFICDEGHFEFSLRGCNLIQDSAHMFSNTLTVQNILKWK